MARVYPDLHLFGLAAQTCALTLILARLSLTKAGQIRQQGSFVKGLQVPRNKVKTSER